SETPMTRITVPVTSGGKKRNSLPNLTALAVDPLAAPGDELAGSSVALTVTGGHVTHRAV
ncbi:hypothetical protein ABT315_43865, partial [Streptomyces puniciscabiei]